MGKNKRNKKGNKNKKANKSSQQQNNSSEATQNTSNPIDEEASDQFYDSLGLTEEQKQKIKENEANPAPEAEKEEEYESTEEKARIDMEQCEKLLGIKDSTDKTFEERKQELEKEKESLKTFVNEREKEELKRINRKNKKLQKEADLIFHNKRSTNDAKLKSLYDLVMKVAKDQILIRESKFDQINRADKIQEEIDSKNRGIDKVIQLKHTLNNVFQGLKEKNIEAYKRKDDAIRAQQDAKKEMTKNFEADIDKVTNSYQEQISLKEKYEEKKKELEKLAEVRLIIEQKEKVINTLQTDINDQIENELKKLMDNFNKEKGKYDKLTQERENLNDQYKTLKDKFHKYLEEIEAGESKLKIYDAERDSLGKKIKVILEENDKIKQEQDMILQQLSSQDEE